MKRLEQICQQYIQGAMSASDFKQSIQLHLDATLVEWTQEELDRFAILITDTP